MIDPKDAWQRIKEAKHLNKQARGVAQALAEWRELAAQKNDIPIRYIMSDLALVGIAQRKPTKLSDLKIFVALITHNIRKKRVSIF